MTIVIQIGNSDNKLSQQDWSKFVKAVGEAVAARSKEVHFHGCSPGDAPWQNACWIAASSWSAEIVMAVSKIAGAYGQDTVAVTVGETDLVPAQ